MIGVILLKETVTCYIYSDDSKLVFAAEGANLRKTFSGLKLTDLYIIGAYSSVLNGEDAVVVGRQQVNNVPVSLFLLKSDLSYIASLVKLTEADRCGFYSLVDFYSKLEPNGVTLDYSSEPSLVKMVISKQGSVVSTVDLSVEATKSTLAGTAKLRVCFLKESDFITPLYQYLCNTQPMLHLDSKKQTFVMGEAEILQPEVQEVETEVTSMGEKEELDEHTEVTPIKSKRGLKKNRRITDSVEVESKMKDASQEELAEEQKEKVRKSPRSLKNSKEREPKHITDLVAEDKIVSQRGSDIAANRKAMRTRIKLDLDADIEEPTISPTTVRAPRSKKPIFITFAVILVFVVAIGAVTMVMRLLVSPGRIDAVQSQAYKLEANIVQLLEKSDAIDEYDTWITPEEFTNLVIALDSVNNSLNIATLEYGEVMSEVFVTNIDEYQYIYTALLGVIEEEFITSTLMSDSPTEQIYEIIITRR